MVLFFEELDICVFLDGFWGWETYVFGHDGLRDCVVRGRGDGYCRSKILDPQIVFVAGEDALQAQMRIFFPFSSSVWFVFGVVLCWLM